MRKIPQDVVEAAKRANDANHARRIKRTSDTVIAEAILAERERCAQLVGEPWASVIRGERVVVPMPIPAKRPAPSLPDSLPIYGMREVK